MTQPDTQAMRTLPPISSLAHQSDLTNRPKSILPASTPRITPILPHIATTATTTSTSIYHPSPHEPVMSSLSHPSYYPLHVTSTPHLLDGYAYDPTKSPPSHLDGRGGQLTSEQVLAEKRRRNAGASARFRDRRKQRERDMGDKCHQLEERVRELEIALSRATGQSVEEIQEGARKPPQQRRRSSSVYSDESQDKHDNFQSLGERVSELENLVGRSRREKDASVKQLQELEKEVSDPLLWSMTIKKF
jgi:Basic region leucine zipper